MENNEKKTQEVKVEDADLLTRAKANSKLILGASIFILVVIIAVMAWFFINQAGVRKADEAIGRADIEQNDSVALELYKEAATMGHKSGNRAAVEVAIRLYQQGDYEGALGYLKGVSLDDNIIAAGAYALKGDCYVNLKQYDEALGAYKKAVKAADKNPAIVPIILIKEANVYRAQENYKAEYEAYKEIMDNYASFMNGNNYDVRKYYERAKAAAGL